MGDIEDVHLPVTRGLEKYRLALEQWNTKETEQISDSRACNCDAEMLAAGRTMSHSSQMRLICLPLGRSQV